MYLEAILRHGYAEYRLIESDRFPVCKHGR